MLRSESRAELAGSAAAVAVAIVLSGTPALAQRREQRLQEVPLSVSAISATDLARRDIDSAVDLSRFVPSLSVVEFGGGRQEIIIRGIGSARGSSSLTGVYLDEIPVTGAQDGFSPAFLDIRTLDLERVEVLKGPQGTLFGEGAVGGVIRYVTKNPALDNFEGRAEGTLYSTESGGLSKEVVGILNAPVVEGVFGIRLVGTYEDKAGWIDNVGTGEKNFNDNKVTNLRVKSLWKPSDDLSITALFNIHRNDGGGSNIVNVMPFNNSLFVQAFDRSVPTDFKDEYEIYNISINYDLGFADFLSSSSRFDARSVNAFTQVIDDAPVPFLEILMRDYSIKARSTSQEFRLASKSGQAFKWVVGASYKSSSLTAEYLSGIDAVLFGGQVELEDLEIGLAKTQRTKAWATFADASYTLADQLEVGGGLRYFHDRRTNFESNDPVATRRSGSFKKLTYRAFIRYAPTKDVSIYVNTANGFRSGGFNKAADIPRGAPASYDPETSLFYEAGVKANLVDGLAALEFAAFRGTYKDQLLDVGVPSPVDGAPLQYTLNAGKIALKGIEWQLRLTPTRNIILTFGGDVLDTKYTKSDGPSIAVGDPLTFVPKYDLTATAGYKFNWSSDVPGFVDLSYSRRGKAYYTFRGGLSNVAQDASKPTDLLQASVGLNYDGFEFVAFVRNIFDERKPLNPHTTGLYTQARPRSLGIKVGKSF